VAASPRARAAKAAVAAVALAVAVGGESTVAKALSQGGLQRVAAWQAAVRPAAEEHALPAAASRDLFRVPLVKFRVPLVKDVTQRKTLLGLPARLSSDGAGIDVGYADAPVTLTLFEDFRCSATADFEAAQGAGLAALAAAHKVLLRYVLESSLDERLPGPGALLATNAARSALAHGGFPEYHALLFANQPDEYTDGFTEARLLQLASSVPYLRGKAFDAEVHGLRYRSWVGQAQADYDAAGVHHGTPSMLLNGREVDLGVRLEPLRDPAALAALVQQSAQAN
jgi:protein-disulfide isomerase